MESFDREYPTRGLELYRNRVSLSKLIDNYGLTQEGLSERVGKKRATIANYLRLLKLPAEIQVGLKDKKIDMGHARALIPVDDPEIQLALYEQIWLKDSPFVTWRRWCVI